jgi:hypothetical protein
MDIIIFNKGLFYYKQGDFITTMRIFLDYLKNILNHNDSMYYKWIIYVNITFILIEGLINLKYTQFVNCLIEQLEEFLFTNIRLKKDDTFTNDLIKIVTYLNDREVIHKFTSTWDESFCLVNLYKAMKNIYEFKLDEAKIYLKDFKKLYKNCIYKEDLKIFRTLHNFYTCLKIKKFYYENSFSKCFKNLNKIHKLTKIEQINLTINNTKIDDRFNENEYIMYYFNSMGIITLKQKKFMISEIFFKSCIAQYKKIYLQIERKESDFSIRLNYIYYVKYNLALCYFFQRKWDQSYIIFREISKNKNMKMNVFIWYRLGLCCLELELGDMRNQKHSECRSDIVSKANGYTGSNIIVPHKNSNMNLDSIVDDNDNDKFDNDDFMDNGAVNLNFIDDDDTPTPYNAKRIILQNNPSGNILRKKILEAIKCFKQVLLLSKSNINSNSKLNEKNELNELYNFYFDKKSAYIDNNIDESFEKASPKIKSMAHVITSTYMNLIFCLGLTQNWTEVLFYCDQYEKSEFYKKDKDMIYKFDNFRIEALINLKLIDKALDLIKNNFNLVNNNDFKGSFYSSNNNVIYADVSYKIVLNVNLAKIHFINNNISEADKCIDNIMLLYANQENIPHYIQNLLIYSSLVKGNQHIALNLIKYKKPALLNLFTILKPIK